MGTLIQSIVIIVVREDSERTYPEIDLHRNQIHGDGDAKLSHEGDEMQPAGLDNNNMPAHA